jgi:hypothetical protein
MDFGGKLYHAVKPAGGSLSPLKMDILSFLRLYFSPWFLQRGKQ